MSSTHMKMMIALRRVRTPTTPIVKRTAESASDSASIPVPPAAEYYGACDGDEKQYARQLECQQILIEQRPCDGPHSSILPHLLDRMAGGHVELSGDPCTRDRHELCNKGDPDQSRGEDRPF